MTTAIVDPMIVNALQQVAAAATPAVMGSACGLIALGLDNQTARISSRVLELAREWRELHPDHDRRVRLADQIHVLDQRHGYYSRALLLNYGALFAFVFSSLLWFATLFSSLPRALPVAAFAVGVSFLAGMSAFAVAAIALARKTTHHEVEEILHDAERRAAEP